MWDVDGVVDVVDRLGEGEAVPLAQPVPRGAIPPQATGLTENKPADAG